MKISVLKDEDMTSITQSDSLDGVDVGFHILHLTVPPVVLKAKHQCVGF